MPSDRELTAQQRSEVHGVLERTRDDLNYVGLTQSAKYISNIRGKLNEAECKTYQDYCDQITVLHDLVLNEIDGRVFGFLPEDHAKYFNQETLFGADVNDKFRAAKYDIKEAGNCYARRFRRRTEHFESRYFGADGAEHYGRRAFLLTRS